MDECSALREFALEWARYLEQRGHRVKRTRSALATLLSRNGRSDRYRWLFLYAEGPTRRLTPIEREQIGRERRRGQKAGEQVFVVIKFGWPVDKVIALPAEKAVKSSRLHADKGGIPWD